MLKGLSDIHAAASHRLLLLYFGFALLIQGIQWLAPDFLPFWFKLYGFQIFLILVLSWLFWRGWRPVLVWNLKIGLMTFGFFALYFSILSVFEIFLRFSSISIPQHIYQGSAMSVFVLQIVLAPVFEELFFRDYLTRAFYRQFHRWTMAIIFSSAFFMLGHFSLYPGALILGVINAILFVKLGSLWPCIIFHGVSNLSWYFLPSLFPALFQWLLDQAWLSFFYR